MSERTNFRMRMTIWPEGDATRPGNVLSVQHELDAEDVRAAVIHWRQREEAEMRLDTNDGHAMFAMMELQRKSDAARRLATAVGEMWAHAFERVLQKLGERP